MLEGVDISHWQGQVDWEKIKAAKDFAYIKATDGAAGTDPLFAANQRGAKGSCIPLGCYHFVRPLEDMQAQVNHFAAAIGLLGEGDLAPMVDLEPAPHNGQDAWTMLTLGQRIKAIQILLEGVKNASGATPIIYTSAYWWNDVMQGYHGFKLYPLEVARYGPQVGNLPNGWGTYNLWQYSETGSCPGVPGKVDLDRYYGTLDQLLKLGRS